MRYEDATGKVWYHVSKRNNAVTFRRLTNNGLEKCDPPSGSPDEELTGSQVTNLMKLNTIPSIKEKNTWIDLLKTLEHEDYRSKIKGGESCILVPRTRMRKFRFAFRDWTKGLKRAQADFFLQNIECLQELWKLSVKEIEKYQYQESFHPGKRSAMPDGSKEISKIQNTIEAACYFKHSYSTQKEINHHIWIQYLDREIAPLSTRNAKFVGGGDATSSGSGGMDLLLLTGRRVCAGEVKVGKDSELFEALLQAMWYASELATESQIARVAKCYQQPNLEKSKVDVAVFSINQKRDPTRSATIKLVEKINKRGGFKNLGCVHLFENHGDDWVETKLDSP